MNIDIRGLEAFLWIAELGSFGRAATHLNISQTAVSHRVRKLEDDLGLPLFTRTTRQVTLTKAGAELLPVSRALLANFEKELTLIRARHTDNAGELVFACVPTLAVHLLPLVFSAFTKRRPLARVRVLDKTVPEIGDMVAAGTAEFGVTLLGADRWNLAAEPLVKDEFLCICPSRHPLAKKDVIGWDDLAQAPLVRFTMPTANRIAMDETLEGRTERLHWIYEVQHTATALMLVQSGLALAAVPSLAARNLPSGLKAIRLARPRITRTVAIVRRRGETPSELAAIFQQALKAHAASLPQTS